MKFKKVNIATARIYGLTKSPYFFEFQNYYTWKIMFSDASSVIFRDLTFIDVGDTEEEAEIRCNQLKENFKQAHINEGDKVAVIFENDGRVRAIGCIGKDLWIDTCDGFVKKTFEELNIIITSLKVY